MFSLSRFQLNYHGPLDKVVGSRAPSTGEQAAGDCRCMAGVVGPAGMLNTFLEALIVVSHPRRDITQRGSPLGF
jgi:hypothetical protein